MVLKTLKSTPGFVLRRASPPFAPSARTASANFLSFCRLLLTLRKFSSCSHSVVHDFLLLFCCYCSTLQHCFPLNVRKLYRRTRNRKRPRKHYKCSSNTRATRSRVSKCKGVRDLTRVLYASDLAGYDAQLLRLRNEHRMILSHGAIVPPMKELRSSPACGTSPRCTPPRSTTR